MMEFYDVNKMHFFLDDSTILNQSIALEYIILQYISNSNLNNTINTGKESMLNQIVLAFKILINC